MLANILLTIFIVWISLSGALAGFLSFAVAVSEGLDKFSQMWMATFCLNCLITGTIFVYRIWF